MNQAQVKGDDYTSLGDEYRRLVLARTGIKSKDLQCPREKSFMTPCVARDGQCALADDDKCVGCGLDIDVLMEGER